MLSPAQPLAIFMAGAVKHPSGKMGFGILRYSPNPVVCVIDPEYAGQDMKALGASPRPCPIVADVEAAHRMGAEVFVLGIAPPGGQIPDAWYPEIDRAAELGMGIVNGLHQLLAPRYPSLKPEQIVWDIRTEPKGLGLGTGAARHLPNRRVLFIGTDMAVGKMTAGLEVYSAARERGVKTEFVATGQIGITVTGRGVPLDAIRVDYAAGAIEREVLAAADAELVIVEGQGALIHPGSTANLPLLRGSCPTHLVLCLRAGQEHLMSIPEISIPPLGAYARMYEDLAEACGTYPRPRTAAVCVNTAALSNAEATAAIDRLEQELGLPCTDPVRFGCEPILDELLR